MISYHRILLTFLALTLITLGCVTSKPTVKIPYPKSLDNAAIKVDSLSDILDSSLIIGNGDINALVYSDSGSVVVNLTKNDVWDARLETLMDPPIPTIDLIKKLGSSETAFPLSESNSGYVLPEGQQWNASDSYHSSAYPCPRQCARVTIIGDGSQQELKGDLNLGRATASVVNSITEQPHTIIRALAQQNAFLIKSDGQLRLDAIKSDGLPDAETGITNDVTWLKQRIPGDLDWPGMEFVVAAGGNGSWKVVTIISSRESPELIKDAVARVLQTLNANPKTLIETHDLHWSQFWSQSGLEFDDPLLERTWYRSLYFLRCFSKPGVQSVGLFAGLINDTPAWHGDYHTNYNIQQTYWGAFAANHPELCEPYDRLIFEYLPRAKWLAKQVFSTNGAYYPHVLFAYEPPEPANCKSRNGRQYIHHTWGMTLGVDGFSVQPMWWRYKYDPDRERLQKFVYPTLREVALFYADFIDQCEGKETVRLGPTVSPEHWGWTKHLDRNFNCAFDIAMARYTLRATIEAAQILDRDSALVERFNTTLKRLPDYPLSDDDRPVVVDVEGAPPIKYNIPVPATPVFPCDVVTYWSPEDEKQIFERTLDNLRWNGNNATFMLAVARARLSMAGTTEWLHNEINFRTRPNGTMSLNRLLPHHRFNDFGHYTEQFGAAMAVSELLLQSVGDIIRIFPALPPGQRASFTDLRAQGGFLVSATGSTDAVETLQIRSLYGGPLRLASPWRGLQARLEGESSFHTVEQNSRGVATIMTKVGDVWHFRSP